jgi:uncharacterized RDD family membrane protein YckC
MPNRRSLQGHYAGFISRLIAFLLDIVIIAITIAVSGAVWSMLLGFFGLEDIFSFVPRFDDEPWMAVIRVATPVIIASLGTFFTIGYFIFFWMLAGQTPGKRFVGIRVVQKNGERIGFWLALRRYILYWVSGIPVFLGFLWVLIDDERRGLHDRLSGTYVIYAWKAKEDETFLKDVEKRLYG